MNKKKREFIKNKYGGLCAYSGTPLEDDWQVDHLVPKLRYELGLAEGDVNDLDNLMPVQKLINHYKRSLPLEDFRTWYMGGLHERLGKLPKNPKVERSIKRKEYMLKVASYFQVTPDKPFSGKFYFETLNELI